jgi:hypothetical protein
MEFEAANVEIGDDVVVIVDELENEDPFYIFLCNRPLHRCQKKLEDEWGNIWYKGEMIIGGVWYQIMVNHRGTNIPYRLFIDSGPTFVYSHMVIASKFPMLPCATRKGGPRFFMVLEVKENFIAIMKDRQFTKINL